MRLPYHSFDITMHANVSMLTYGCLCSVFYIMKRSKVLDTKKDVIYLSYVLTANNPRNLKINMHE